MEFDIKVLVLGDKYKDPDEAIKSDLPYFKKQLEQSVPVWDFIIQSQIKINNPDTLKGKKEILSVVLPFIVKIKNSVIRSDYFQKLADELGSNQESIIEESKKYLPVRSVSEGGLVRTNSLSTQKSETQNFQEPVKTEKFEQLLLTLIIGAKNPLKLSQKLTKQLSRFQDHRYQIIASLLINTESFDPKTFEDLLPSEIRPTFQSIYINSTVNIMDSHLRLLETQKTVAQLDSIFIKDRLNALSHQISKLEDQNKETELIEVEKEYNALLSELSKVQIKKS